MRTLIELSHNRGSSTFNVYLIDGTYELFRHCYALLQVAVFAKFGHIELTPDDWRDWHALEPLAKLFDAAISEPRRRAPTQNAGG